MRNASEADDNVKIIILTAPTAWGGSEVQSKALAETLAERWHNISFVELGNDIFSRAALDFQNKGIELVHKKFGHPMETLSFSEAWRLSRGFKADIIVFQKSELESGNWQLDLAARLAVPRFVVIENSLSGPMIPNS